MNPWISLAWAAALAGTTWWLTPWLAGGLHRKPPPRWLSRRLHVLIAATAGAALPLLQVSTAEQVVLAIAALGVLLAATVDAIELRLPNAVLSPTAVSVLTGWTLIASHTGSWQPLITACLCAVGTGAVLLAVCLTSPTHLGLGDVKLAAVVSLTLGWFGWPTVILGLFATSLLALAIATTLTLARRRSAPFPLGPTLAAGTAIALALN